MVNVPVEVTPASLNESNVFVVPLKVNVRSSPSAVLIK